MKQFITLILLFAATVAQAQEYKNYFEEGMKRYQQNDFYNAYLQFNASKVFAKTSGNAAYQQKADEWATKAAEALNAELKECRRQAFIADSIARAQAALRQSILEQLPLPDGVSNAFDYYYPLADTLYAKGFYEKARNFYQLLVQLSEAEKHQQVINTKINACGTLAAKTAEALNLMKQNKWQEASDVYSYIMQTNATDSLAPNRLKSLRWILKYGDLIFVEGGTFKMGSPKGQGQDDEYPQHDVTLSSYFIGKTEVTNRMYADFLKEYGSDVVKEGIYKGQSMIGEYKPKKYNGLKNKKGEWQVLPDKDNYPVIYVTWYGAYEFCRYYGFSLPTEAQWEYAARGGNVGTRRGTSLLYAGSDNIDEVAEYDGNNGKSTKAVAGRKPNELGIYDMSGNVWEWCADWYGAYTDEAKTHPAGAESGSRRVLRGGSWYSFAIICRVANRSYWDPDDRYDFLGFRLVFFP